MTPGKEWSSTLLRSHRQIPQRRASSASSSKSSQKVDQLTSNLNNVDINDASGRFSPRIIHLVQKISNMVVTIPCFVIVLLQGKLDLLEHPIFELFILLKWARVHFLFKVWFTWNKICKHISKGHFPPASSPRADSPQLCPSPLWQFLHHWQQHRHQRQRFHGLLLRLHRLQQLPFCHPDGKIGCFGPKHQMLLLIQSFLLNSTGSGRIF